MITMSKLDITNSDGSTSRIHFAIRYEDYSQLERLVRLALKAPTQSAQARDATVSVTILSSNPIDG